MFAPEIPDDSVKNEEILEMAANHRPACEVMDQFTAKQFGHVRKLALDVGCGSGTFALDSLCKKYERVDMFDICPDEVLAA